MKKISLTILVIFICYSLYSQNVGIGTTTPAFKLEIKSSLVQPNNNTHLLSLIGRNPVISFHDETNISHGYIKSITNLPNPFYANGMEFGADPGNSIYFSTNYSPTMVIANSNNVGIGNSNPAFKLDIRSSLVQSNNNTNLLSLGGLNPVLSFKDENDNFMGYIKSITNNPIPGYSQGMEFGADPGNSIFFSNNYAPTMMLSSNGNVGIGTTSPSGRLNIDVGNQFSGEALRLTGTNPFLSFHLGPDQKGYIWNKNTNDMEFGTAGVNSNGNLFLSISGTPYLTLQPNGKVKIGTGGPSVLYNAGDYSLTATNGVVLKANYANAYQDEWMIHVTVSLGELQFFKNGNWRAFIDDAGDWNSVSDIRLKKDIAPFKSVLVDLQKLQISTYRYKSDVTGKKSFGLIAQNVAEYFPEIISGIDNKDRNGCMGIAYGKTGVLALKAIQEQQLIIESQQKNIDDQQKKIVELERRLAALEKK